MLQITAQYDGLMIGAKGVYEPNDKLSVPIVEYTFAKPVGDGIIKWTSADASIDNISVYALDNTYKAENVSYEQDPNDTDIWKSKLKDKDSKNDAQKDKGIPTVFIVIYSVILAIILALVAVFIVITVKKRGIKQ